MKKSLIILFSLIVVCFSQVTEVHSLEKKIVVAITQIIEHPAIDQEREGILEAFKAAGFEPGKNMELIYQSAQGRLETMTQIAAQIISRKPDIVFALSTASSQTLKVGLEKAGIPLVFGAVTDPVGAKLVNSVDKRPENITGASDRSSMKPQLELIKALIPTVRRVGVICNAGETNSQKAVQELKEAARDLRLEIIEANANNTSEAAAATASLVGKVEAIFIPNDNTASAAIDSIVAKASSNNVPLFAADVGGIAHGCVAGYVLDRHELGQVEGKMGLDILAGKKAGDIPVLMNHPPKLQVNKKALTKLNVTLPEALAAQATMIGDE